MGAIDERRAGAAEPWLSELSELSGLSGPYRGPIGPDSQIVQDSSYRSYRGEDMLLHYRTYRIHYRAIGLSDYRTVGLSSRTHPLYVDTMSGTGSGSHPVSQKQEKVKRELSYGQDSQ